MYRILLLVATVAFLASLPLPAQGVSIDEDFLEILERRAFDYFWKECNPRNGLVRNTTEYGAPASPTACAFALAAIPIGIERGWIDKKEGYERALLILRTFRDKLYHKNGFFYHYLDFGTGERMWGGEVSLIDSAIFFYGAIVAGEYFKGTEVEALAREIYERANWDWFRAKDSVLKWEWTKERGFRHRMSSFSESIMAYILAIGSPTHPIEPSSWDNFRRPIAKLNGDEMVYCESGSLFTYLLSCTFIDFRNKHDKYIDYWTNTKKAIRANRAFCMANKAKFKSYDEDSWGISASMGPDGYKNYGAWPGAMFHDGTVTPYAVVASLPLEPERSMQAIRNFYTSYKKKIWGKYGFTDAFNVDKNWWCGFYIAIDKGMELLMLENYRSGLIWELTMKNDYVNGAFRRIGFMDGARTDVRVLKATTGNPNAMTIISKMRVQPVIDGKPQEIEGLEFVVLTTKENRNVEVELGLFEDDNDASAEFYIGYGQGYLYLFGKIRDDDIWAKKTKSEIYQNDCVEIFFDTDRNGFSFDGNPYDFQWGFSPPKDGGKGSAWAWGPIKGSPKQAEHVFEKSSDGYTIEAKIPFKEMKHFNPKLGDEILFNVAVHDQDGDGTEGKLVWSIDKDPRSGKIFFGKAKFGP